MSSGCHPFDNPGAGFNPNQIVAQIVELLLDAGLRRAGDRQDTHNRRNADTDTQYNQKAARLVAKQHP